MIKVKDQSVDEAIVGTAEDVGRGCSAAQDPLKFADVGIIQVPKYPHRSLLVATNLETSEL